MAQWSFVLQVISEAVDAVITVNGFQAPEISKQKMALSSSLAEWLVLGNNRIEARLYAPEPGPDDPERVFELLLHRTKAGHNVWDGSRFFEYRYSPVICDQATRRLATVVDHTFLVEDELEKWSWLSARPYEAGDRKHVEDVVMALHGALERKDLTAIKTSMSTMLTERALALEASRDDCEEAYLAEIGDYLTEEDWEVDELNHGDLVLVPDHGGRVVHVRDREGRAPLKAIADGRRFSMPLSIANLNGTWSIVR